MSSVLYSRLPLTRSIMTAHGHWPKRRVSIRFGLRMLPHGSLFRGEPLTLMCLSNWLVNPVTGYAQVVSWSTSLPRPMSESRVSTVLLIFTPLRRQKTLSWRDMLNAFLTAQEISNPRPEIPTMLVQESLIVVRVFIVTLPLILALIYYVWKRSTKAEPLEISLAFFLLLASFPLSWLLMLFLLGNPEK